MPLAPCLHSVLLPLLFHFPGSLGCRVIYSNRCMSVLWGVGRKLVMWTNNKASQREGVSGMFSHKHTEDKQWWTGSEAIFVSPAPIFHLKFPHLWPWAPSKRLWGNQAWPDILGVTQCFQWLHSMSCDSLTLLLWIQPAWTWVIWPCLSHSTIGSQKCRSVLCPDVLHLTGLFCVSWVLSNLLPSLPSVQTSCTPFSHSASPVAFPPNAGSHLLRGVPERLWLFWRTVCILCVFLLFPVTSMLVSTQRLPSGVYTAVSLSAQVSACSKNHTGEIWEPLFLLTR